MSRFSYSQEELKILKYWEEIDAFKQSLKQSEGRPEYLFYDGPPFATGLPHYGHILAGTIKDVVTRYWHMQGFHVTRRFGWDCHGLPIEFEVEKLFGIGKPTPKGGDGNVSLKEYNEKCRQVVMRYSSEWRQNVTRLGRWIDFDNGYKTMDTKYMESVWWAFKELDKKGLVYKGVKVMPFSTALHTPLSNFEAGQNYQNVSDPAITVAFKLKEAHFSSQKTAEGNEMDTYVLAWTTTPWTLPSNMALAVNPDFEYVRVRGMLPNPQKPKEPKIPTNTWWIISAERLSSYFTSDEIAKMDQTEIIRIKGSEMEGWKYEALFPYFVNKIDQTGLRIVSGSFVEEGSGTGIVHCAPFFGEDDNAVCLKNGVINAKGEPFVCPVNEDGCFTDDVTDFKGMYVKDADTPIIKLLKSRHVVVKQEMYKHSYPFCWRSDTPLLYKAVPSWFVSVETIKTQDLPPYHQVQSSDEYNKMRTEKREQSKGEGSSDSQKDNINRLIEANQVVRWVPDKIKARFTEWLLNARDWAISRNRFWGTPLPIWESEDGEERVVIGSIAELEEATGIKGITDIHTDFVDQMTIPSKKGKGLLKRVGGVFDCWFESGSMPFAQNHYPFENKEFFERSFPGEFIAEGVDQTRGWFYTLLVLSQALFGMCSFKNVIVNGIVLASNGQKMSKRLKNYPDPMGVVSRSGADALRLYLISSPAVHAEDLAFTEEGVQEVVRQVMNPWWNCFLFFQQYVSLFNHLGGKPTAAMMMGTEGDKDPSSSDTPKPDESFTPTPSPSPASGEEKVRFIHDRAVALGSTNVTDRWILLSTQQLISQIRTEMSAYRLYTVVPLTLSYISDLTNWYVRLNRPRLKGVEGAVEWHKSLCVLFEVLHTLSVMMTPFTPFICEMIYQGLKPYMKEEEKLASVHFSMYPKESDLSSDSQSCNASSSASASASSASSSSSSFTLSETDSQLCNAMAMMKQVIVLGRQIREKAHLSLKIPMKELCVLSFNDSVRSGFDKYGLNNYIKTELNVSSIVIKSPQGIVNLSCNVSKQCWKNAAEMSKRAGKSTKEFVEELGKVLQKQPKESIEEFEISGKMKIVCFDQEYELGRDDVVVERSLLTSVSLEQFNQGLSGSSKPSSASKRVNVAERDLIVEMTTEVDQTAIEQGHARSFVNRVMQLRKRLSLLPEDHVEVFVKAVGKAIPTAGEKSGDTSSACYGLEHLITTVLVDGVDPSASSKGKEEKKDKRQVDKERKLAQRKALLAKQAEAERLKEAKKKGIAIEASAKDAKKEEEKEAEKEAEEKPKQEKDANEAAKATMKAIGKPEFKIILPERKPVVEMTQEQLMKKKEEDNKCIQRLSDILTKHYSVVRSLLRQDVYPLSAMPMGRVEIGRSLEEVDGMAFELVLVRPGIDYVLPLPSVASSSSASSSSSELEVKLALYLEDFVRAKGGIATAEDGKISINFASSSPEADISTFTLLYKKDWFLSTEEKWNTMNLSCPELWI
ncbi:putative isoleucyl-tRNA synthetase [Monocercomonoides exilis]|uniref:putative isoleucyl-tRNA synthetase n=1 Tax=Monocercomonoides exilis TaxID=2049356 RepID=UPI00355AB4A8|nr:putative isoleucyl-tRNA synthetase [Monocercomonoides exilis]|eukprot:MONOS_13648.1-p1 / transcript=MONOS_13648.1 / gene=MONOS_13648 / organism=Monocercomonoides_exilis_PA203 / gene_product=isoleucyl-tRNA synthetase / transcript_product=isoleucyl-tRNA synthetase / location=Mono_scaffold00858:4353-8955(+) / protein_length=1486 / sequence_SO=supercontig / SO=protein_coding / is_pseudo=false